MARIHVIYDPNDKLTSQSEHMNRLGIKIAIMPLPDNSGSLDIEQTARKIASMLLIACGYSHRD